MSALIARAQSAGAFATVLHKGDAGSGSVLVNVRGGDGQHVLYQGAQNVDGARVWLASQAQSEAAIGQKIAKRRAFDEDLWVIEIEDRKGRHFLTEPIEDMSRPAL